MCFPKVKLCNELCLCELFNRAKFDNFKDKKISDYKTVQLHKANDFEENEITIPFKHAPFFDIVKPQKRCLLCLKSKYIDSTSKSFSEACNICRACCVPKLL